MSGPVVLLVDVGLGREAVEFDTAERAREFLDDNPMLVQHSQGIVPAVRSARRHHAREWATALGSRARMRLVDLVAAEVERASRERADALDQLCLSMLSDPERRGILVVHDGLDWSAELTPDVPWLMIHEYPNGRREV